MHATSLILSLVPLASAISRPSMLAALTAALGTVALLAESYFAIRTGIDATLFSRLAREDLPSPGALADLDRGLEIAGFAQSRGNRPLSTRIAGARRLFRSECIAAAFVALSALAAILLVATA